MATEPITAREVARDPLWKMRAFADEAAGLGMSRKLAATLWIVAERTQRQGIRIATTTTECFQEPRPLQPN